MKNGLDAAIRALQSNRLDSQLIGLESLEKLSSNMDIASMIVHGKCLSRLLECCESNSDASLLNQIEGWNQCQMRRRALSILANGIMSCKSNESDIPIKLTEEDFIKQLLFCLEKSVHEPHEAYHAVRCLNSLITPSSSSSSSSSSDNKIVDVLNDLNLMALVPSPECRHLALEEETKKLKLIFS